LYVIRSNESFIRAGAALLLLKPKSKAPVGEEWSEQPVATFEELERRCKGHNVGVRLGKWSKISGLYLHVIDVDIRSREFDKEARAALEGVLFGYDYMSFPRVKSGSGGPSFHVYFLTDKPFKSKKLAQSDGFRMVKEKSSGKEVKKRDWEIELFGTGKQVVIPPSIHPETGNEYEWQVEFDPAAECPHVEVTDMEVLVREDEVLTGTVDFTDVTADEVRRYSRKLDLDYWCEDREGWIKYGMALHHEFEGSDEGFKLWCEFAKQSKKFSSVSIKSNGVRSRTAAVALLPSGPSSRRPTRTNGPRPMRFCLACSMTLATKPRTGMTKGIIARSRRTSLTILTICRRSRVKRPRNRHLPARATPI
jgi:hypothetical protein